VVRQRAGRRELRIDGTYASARGPGGESGPVWNAMSASVLAVANRAPRVLVLGLAGGSVVRGVLALRPRARFVGVEIDPDVVAAGKRHFGLDELPLEVVCADALDYLRRTRRRFDLVIDDVFVGRGRRVHKPVWLPEPGFQLATTRLRPEGVIVSNTLDETATLARGLAERVTRVLELSLYGWDNRILIGGSAELSGRELRAAARRAPALAETLPILAIRTRY
jgi:spermidine synthase